MSADFIGFGTRSELFLACALLSAARCSASSCTTPSQEALLECHTWSDRLRKLLGDYKVKQAAALSIHSLCSGMCSEGAALQDI
eukprot:3295738-Amphidinium_carterae.1